jgi:hypothetical protein
MADMLADARLPCNGSDTPQFRINASMRVFPELAGVEFRGLMTGTKPFARQMLRYMLDTNICIYAMKKRPESLRGRFNRLSEQL